MTICDLQIPGHDLGRAGYSTPALGALSETRGPRQNMLMNEPVYGHLRPDLIAKLVDAITNLVWGKQQVLELFQNAGVPNELLNDFHEQVERDRASVKKPIMIRAILQRMNSAGDKPEAIRMRRELVRRVIEWKNFSTCQPNCEDLARGAIAAVREIVGKYDFLTEIRNERDRQRDAQIRGTHEERLALAARKEAWDAVKHDFMACFGISDHQLRGRTFEQVMNRLFVHAQLAAKPPFTIYGESGKLLEQIDGSIELDGCVYIVEIKWWEGRVEQKELSAFACKVFMRSESRVRGLFISASPYTEASVNVAEQACARDRAIILFSLREFFDVVNADGDIRELIRDRIRLLADKKRVIAD
jgi:hypothetical protein